MEIVSVLVNFLEHIVEWHSCFLSTKCEHPTGEWSQNQDDPHHHPVWTHSSPPCANGYERFHSVEAERFLSSSALATAIPSSTSTLRSIIAPAIINIDSAKIPTLESNQTVIRA